MFKRGFFATAFGALTLLLTAAQTCPAQFVTFPVGRGGIAAFPVRRFGFFPSTFNSPIYGSPYYTPMYGGYTSPYYQTNSTSYSVNTVTPLYYGAASFAPGYSTAYSSPRLVSPSLGSLAPLDGATSASYDAPAYPVRSPDYNVINPVSPQLSQLAAYSTAGETASVQVLAPANAEIWFDGHATHQTGADRSFTTPALDQGQDYVYKVRAHWDADGKAVDRTKEVTVRAGGRVVVDFR